MRLTHICSCRFHLQADVWTLSDALRVYNVTISQGQFLRVVFLWTLTGSLQGSWMSQPLWCKWSRRLWCQPNLKNQNKSLPLTQATKSAQDSTWHSRWNASQICWTYFAYPPWGRVDGKKNWNGSPFTIKKKCLDCVHTKRKGPIRFFFFAD